MDEFLLCSQCGEIPEILDVHTDNGKIELKCKNCGTKEILINDYYDKLSENNYFRNCEICNSNDDNLYYCYECGFNLCEACKNLESHKKHKFIIKLDKKEDFCPKHSKQFKYFCNNCKENFCEEEKEKEHKNHEIIDIKPKDEEYKKYIKTIEDTNEEIKRIIEFNELVMNTGKKFKNNYFHLKSIINLGESIKEGNKREYKDIKCLLNGLENDLEKSKKVINSFEQKKIKLDKKSENISIIKKELNDSDFKNLSYIIFNQLIEIDISENKIINIDPLKTMSLPFLEFLNLGHNLINKIEPILELKSNNLKYIFLQNNKIEDIKPILNSDFKSLEILRVEDNIFNKKNNYIEKEKEKEEEKENKKENKNEKKKNIEKINLLKQITKKLPGKFIYESIEDQINAFKVKYKLEDISGDNKVIDLHDKKGGDEMLKKLFLIITYKTENQINKLILRNNNIKNPSLLSRIHFNKLHVLDLSVNKITNINFFSDMKAKRLKKLYLDHNHLNCFYPLLYNKFPHLKILSLNDNNFNCDNYKKSLEYKKILKKYLKENGKSLIQLINLDFDDIENNSNNQNESNDISNNSKSINSIA